jgi:hypothetical protein
MLHGNEAVLIELCKQYERATVASRAFTGTGFHTTFKIPNAASRVSPTSFQIGDVIGKVDGISNGVGFLLYIKDGALYLPEGYTYGDEKWPETLRDYELSYASGAIRDVERLRSKWSGVS